MAPANAETPERLANQKFNQRCLMACSNFYNDSPERSLSEGCRILKDEVFQGKGVISCNVAKGQDRFPTWEMYLRDALTSGSELRLDKTRMQLYKNLLSPDEYERLLDAIDSGTAKYVRLDKQIRYETFRHAQKQPDALAAYIRAVKPDATFNDVKELARDVCAMTEYQSAPKSKRTAMLKEKLLGLGLALRPVDAKKMATDIQNVFENCGGEEA